MSPGHRSLSATWFVAVLGAPAVGKSTLTGALPQRFGARVFRLREFAHHYRNRPGVDQRLFDTRDRFGWLPEQTVDVLLRAAFLNGGFPAQGLVVLENFPGSLTQLRLIAAIAQQRSAPLTLVELAATDSVLAKRCRTRRVCSTCEPDPRGDPHRPARPSPHHPDQCDHCGAALLPRQGDQPHRFAARLARFRHRMPEIRHEATALGLPYHPVPATGDPNTVRHHVTAVLAATPAAPLLAPLPDHV